ncbi:MAG: InlB B-repeat-containing protein [Eubacterium sp.]|nr:InlB B-repeat-containing protein [Eubacterium sp.]
MDMIGKGKRNKIKMGRIAGVLAASLLFGVIGSHADLWTITVQAEENNNMEAGNVLSLGSFHSAVIKENGSLWMWGSNGYGQLGNGTTESSTVPIKIMENVKSVSLGAYHSAAIKEDGSLWMWGRNSSGQLGNGISDSYYTSVNSTPIKIMENVRFVALYADHSAAVKEDGSLWMWGSNGYGQLGNGTTESSTVPIKIMENVRFVSTGYDHSAAIKEDGSLWMWGSNGYGQLGNGTTEKSITPVKVMENVRTISLGQYCTAAIKTNGNLWMWGSNGYGQLGNGTKENSTTPIEIMQSVKSISLGGFLSAAIKEDSSLWMWGDNRWGQLGNGTKENSMIPVKIIEEVKFISMIGFSSASIKADGSLWMWGSNEYGQLGNGTTENSLVPIQIMPPGSISTSGSTDPSDPNDPDDPDSEEIFYNTVSGPLIKVMDADGKPIEDAIIYYRSMFSYKTSNKGMAELELKNYLPGAEVMISKSGYETKIIQNFVRSKTGIDTYTLSKAQESGANEETEETIRKKLADLVDGIYLVKDKEVINLLTEEAQINTYYKNSLNSKFNIVCKAHEEHDSYHLYSGDRIIKLNNSGEFLNLELKDFTVGEPVYLIFRDGNNKPDIKKKLNLRVVNISPPVDMLYMGKDGLKIAIPDNIPIVGGETIQIELDDLPVNCHFKSDGTIQIGINIDKFMKKKGMEFDEIFPSLKNLTEGNVSSFLGKDYTEYSKSSAIKPDYTIIGYLESNVSKDDPFYLQGKLFVELSLEYAHEQQLSVGPVPVVVEISIEGKINADGSIKWTAEKGVEGSVGVGGGFGLGVYGGVGIAKVASAGIYGDAEFGLHYVIIPEKERGLDKAYIGGELGLEGKVLGKSYKCGLIHGTWYIVSDGVVSQMSAEKEGWENVSINDYSSYNTNSRSYLAVNGTMPEWEADREYYINGSMDETVLQSSSCFDSVPQVIRMGDTVMLFYLTDAGTVRDAADRSMLVYSLWDETAEEWGEPKALLDDGTADYSPDFYTDGEKLYVVWQDAKENLSDDLSLEETAERMTLHAAVYDEAQKTFIDLGKIESENRLFQQNPQIVADDNSVSVYWYENAQDNVLGLTGSNRIYRADLADQNVLTEGIQVMSVSENTAAVFRKFVALEEESVSENTIPEDGEENDTSPVNPGEENEGENKKSEEAISDNTLPEESVSENTVSENAIQVNTYNTARQADQPWTVTFLQEEKDCILSADAGRMNGKAGYAFVAGTMDQTYNVEQSKAAFIEQGQNQTKILADGAAEKVEFASVYAGETLTWYEAGDISYIDENGSTANLFGESRIPSWSYTLLSDGTAPEVFFPVNAGGKSNLYRIGYENGAFLPSLQVTEQEDYIQYADGFIRGGETILVYNKMKVNDELEEVNNSLCTGTIAHSYCDIAMQSAGSMVLYNEETDENDLEIAVQLYNNGTVKAENLSLSLCAPDGSVLESVPIDVVLDPGEADNTSAVFSLDSITQEAEYTITLSGAEETNKENNSVKLTLGSASLRVEAKAISIADTRTIQAGIQNTGVTACGGTVSLRDSATGEEYASGNFEPIEKGKMVVVEVELPPSIFREKEELALEVVVIPDSEKVETVRDFVKAYSPSYEVNFVTDAGISTVYANYGAKVSFPENPTKNGKYFIGWYDAKNASEGTFYTEETPIEKDLTLYACFADQERTQIPLSECSVSAIPAQYHTGSAIKPKLTVKWGSEVLKDNTDYTVTYQNNKEQGKATATVAGKGKYSGSISRDFMIYYPISKVSVKAIPAVNFSGEEHTPELTITYKGKNLVKNTDYTVAYTNNRNAGTAGVTITGKGKYNGQKTVTFQIKGTAISGMKFEKIPDVTYNGAATRPIITVKTKDGKQLMSGSDYRLVYENTVKKGTASVTVIGNGNYTGTKKLSYKIVAKPLTEAMISQVAEQTYTGSAIKPAVTVTDREAGNAVLVRDQDYTVSYSKNKAVGTAKITVKGKGNYSGKVELPFTISPVELAQAQETGKLEIRVNDMAYTGRALKPAVQLYEITDGREKKIPAGAYTVTYANNTEMGTGTVTVTGKDQKGYTGTVTATFRIVEKAKLITASTIKIDAVPAQTFTGAELKPAVHIVDRSDKTKEITLEQGTHYEVSYKNNVNAGKAAVTVKGIGSYAGSKNITFQISKRPIAGKNVLGQGFTIDPVADLKYTGYALKPDVVLKDNGATLEQGKDYKLSYKNNTRIGTATVTVKGMGNYSGSINTTTFRITAWDYGSLRAEVERQTYTGKAIKPKITFYVGEEEINLKSGTAVKISYKDNKNVGTATVTVSGKGELSGIEPLTLTFAVEPADLADAVVNRIANQTLKGVPVKPVPKVRVGKNSLKAGRDFTVSYLRNGVKGEATVIINGVGNYTGECRKTFIVQ